MHKKLLSSAALAALILPGAAFAQSTGSVDFENGGADIVVTARATAASAASRCRTVPALVAC